MKIVVLASGSKGNATYIETDNTKILIDAGISFLQIRNRLAMRNIILDKLDAIVVTHEHTDHIKYLTSIATKTSACVYINKVTYLEANRRLSGGLTNINVKLTEINTKYQINDIALVPIRLSHDVEVCCGYLFKELVSGNVTYGYITDTGYIPDEYLKLISTLQVISLESNHDIDMLKYSKRPWPLIQRILSDNGHLSNVQCCNYLKMFNYEHVKNVILSHISDECNTEELVLKEINKTFNNNLPTKFIVAKQHEPLEVIEVK